MLSRSCAAAAHEGPGRDGALVSSLLRAGLDAYLSAPALTGVGVSGGGDELDDIGIAATVVEEEEEEEGVAVAPQ